MEGTEGITDSLEAVKVRTRVIEAHQSGSSAPPAQTNLSRGQCEVGRTNGDTVTESSVPRLNNLNAVPVLAEPSKQHVDVTQDGGEARESTPERATAKADSRGGVQSLNGKPVGRDLDFALAVISAIRFEHPEEPMVTRPLTCEEISELTHDILEVIGRRGCTKQNISRIELRTLRKVRVKLYCDKKLEGCLHSWLQTK